LASWPNIISYSGKRISTDGWHHQTGPSRRFKNTLDFALSEAKEAEGIRVNRGQVRKGIRAALEDESVAIYWVLQGSRDEIVGNISVVKEWSNWKAGYYWWI
jgi:hypothetical protein